MKWMKGISMPIDIQIQDIKLRESVLILRKKARTRGRREE